MEYARERSNDSPYVSVNTLIKPRKNWGLSDLPSATTSNLTMSQPGDPAELEADRVADQVVHDAGALVTSNQISPIVQRETTAVTPLPAQENLSLKEEQAVEPGEKSEFSKERKLVQPKTMAAATAGVESSVPQDLGSQINGLNGKGSPLPEGVRTFFEGGFNRDFKDVRVHTDSQSQEMAQSINAKAFTVGNDVVFAKGEYVPGTYEGQKLLAHELTHVAQQGDNRSQIDRQSDEGEEGELDKAIDIIRSVKNNIVFPDFFESITFRGSHRFNFRH